jgi:D-alanine--poly(phosphoribitol) ligase subunit 1
MPIASVETDAAVDASLGGLFTESVRRFPDRPALIVAGRPWTYSQLDAECKKIEELLRAASLSGTQSHVGLIYARGAFSYASIIAIMRSHNVYVPLNGKLPAGRLLRMIEDANLAAVVVDAGDAMPEGVREALRQAKPLQIIANEGRGASALDAICASSPQHLLWRISRSSAVPGTVAERSTQRPVDSRRLAYIIYTSGSTGIPKGVAIEHESVCRCMERLQTLFGTHERDRFTQFSPLSFDGSIFDLFLCWRSGGASCVPSAEEALVPLSFVLTNEITVWGSVPSLANFLVKLQLLNGGTLPQIRLSFFFGEALPVELALAWTVAAPGSRIFNLYGPTECSICATYYEYERQSSQSHGMVPIGAPLPGIRYKVVEDGHPVAEDDLPGELWLAGDQLAVGYWNNPTATRAAFARAPFEDSDAVWYRTGDLVSDRRGVGLSFRGRLDRQVKLRGVRIELQEIEGLLRDEIGCALVAVVPVRNAGGICERLVAFCEDLRWDEATVKIRCLKRMPPYMVPERIVELKEFPLNDHGKVDYRSLVALTVSTAG